MFICLNIIFSQFQNYPYSVWGEASGKAAHDYIGQWSEIPGFNDSVAVPQVIFYLVYLF